MKIKDLDDNINRTVFGDNNFSNSYGEYSRIEKIKSKMFLFLLSIIISILVLSIIVLKFLELMNINYLAGMSINNLMLINFIGLVSVGIGGLIYSYLQYGNSNELITVNNKNKLAYFEEINDLKLELYKLKHSSGKEKIDESKISEVIKNIAKETLTDGFILDTINSTYGDKIYEASKNNDLKYFISEVDGRLMSEIGRLRRSANLNLLIGVFTTLLAIYIIGYDIFRNDINYNNYMQLISHYVPRLSLVIFIEIFAFFFLKLYKTSLFDIKYFNNEKTNFDFKILALNASKLDKPNAIYEYCIKQFADTERNFTIRNGESTIELEKDKLEKEKSTAIYGLAEKIVENIKR